jgi:hypothetical protein
MFDQESALQQFATAISEGDTFVIVGLDRDKQIADRIPSRGFGMAQYTLFHHPPTQDEVASFIVDPDANINQAVAELKGKFDGLAGGASRAVERDAEHPGLPLRKCRYSTTDERFLRDCRACARRARHLEIARGTPLYQGASQSYQPDGYYPSADYGSVPDRADMGCDWPYAIRRYNGGGLDSFHYQTRVLRNLERLPDAV